MKRPYPIIAALVSLGVFSFILLIPFLQTLVLSAITGYILYPLYKKIDSYIPRYAAITLCIILVIICTVPLIVLVQSLIQESISIINIIKSLLTKNQSTVCTNLLCEQVQTILQNNEVNLYLQKMLDTLANKIFVMTSSMISTLPALILQIAIFFFSLYYALKDGQKIMVFIDKASQQIKSTLTVHLQHMDSVMRAILYGYFSVAMLQGSLALLGYIILGIPNPFFWATLTAMFALIPIIGTAIIWLPLAIMQIANGIAISEYSYIIKGAILLAYGLFIISTIDNFIRPGIIAAKVNVHPLTIFIGIIGGLKILGLAGFIIGPVILSTTIRMVQDTVNP